jgi:hypothetical protein
MPGGRSRRRQYGCRGGLPRPRIVSGWPLAYHSRLSQRIRTGSSRVEQGRLLYDQLQTAATAVSIFRHEPPK